MPRLQSELNFPEILRITLKIHTIKLYSTDALYLLAYNGYIVLKIPSIDVIMLIINFL